MLWSQDKKIRDFLEAILFRIGLIEHSLESIKDNTRHMHHDISDKQKSTNEKLDELKDCISKLVPVKKSKYVKKPKDVANNVTRSPL